MCGNEYRSAGNLRKFILITLAQSGKGERKGIEPQEMGKRVENLFECTAIVIAREEHQDGEGHHHIAVLNQNASRKNATMKIRKAFPEWQGRQCNVAFHRAWRTLCAYVTKEDKNPYVWGSFSLEEILQEAGARRSGKGILQEIKKEQKVRKLYETLRESDNFFDLRHDPEMASHLLNKYHIIRNLWEDEQRDKSKKKSPMEILVAFLEKKGWPKEYMPEELKEKYLAIDWIAVNLLFERRIKTRQLFIYGPPNAQKSLFISFLKKIGLRVYSVGHRKNDFSGAHDFFDLWVIDEFTDESEKHESAQRINPNALLTLLDGQETRLDAKYEKTFVKKANVPIILLGNHLPFIFREIKSPFAKRVIPLQFQSHAEDLDEARIAATLYAAMCLRAAYYQEKDKSDPVLRYNSARVVEKPVTSDEVESLLFLEDLPGIPLPLLKAKNTYEAQRLIVPFSFLNESRMNLIKFAAVPIPKNEGNPQSGDLDLENQKEENFFRSTSEDHEPEWTVWPLILNRSESTRALPLALHVLKESEPLSAALSDYPRLLEEAEDAEKQILGELLLGHPRENQSLY